jgi:predicted dehydrogenase
MDRRDFIRNGSLVAGGLLLSNQLLHANTFTVGEKITVGIIGCGDRGKGIMSVLKQLNDQFAVIAICDVLDFRIEEAKKVDPTNSLTVYKDYKALLDDKNIQSVVIATPLSEHYKIAADALKAGKHVYLEKTMTYSIDQAIDLVKLSKSHDKQVLQVGHQYRYSPLYFSVKEMIQKGYLGKVVQIDCRWDRNWNWRRPVPSPELERKINWRMYKEYSGGLVAELLSHQIDFINWAFDTHPNEIVGVGGIDYFKDGRETNDNVQAILRYGKDNMIGNFGATCGNAHDGYIFKIKGTKGAVHLLTDDGVFYPEKGNDVVHETVDGVTGATKIVEKTDGGISLVKEKLKDGTWYALKDFYKCITEKSVPASNIITGATTAVCVHLANKAIDSRATQNWKATYNFS